MSQYIFIYGTLLPELASDEIAAAVSRLRLVGEGSVGGVLYDLGHYPGARVDASSEQKIFGKVYELPEDEGVLHALDSYEGFNSNAVADSLFVRQMHEVELADRRTLQCWIYVYNLEPHGARELAEGRYRTRTPA